MATGTPSDTGSAAMPAGVGKAAAAAPIDFYFDFLSSYGYFACSSSHSGRKETEAGENPRDRRRRPPNESGRVGCGRRARQKRTAQICRGSW